VASFDVTPITGTTPLSVQFNDTSTGDVTSWNWSFGDNSAWFNTTVPEERNVTHQYSKHGVFESQLIVMNSAGENTTKQTITVTQKAPVASFDATPKSGIAPLFVQFNDTSTGDMTSWNWSFGDGSSWVNTTVQEERNVTHTYNMQGAYAAKLLVQNSGGESTATETITVSTPPPENQPPVLANIGTKEVIAGQLLQFTISASDPDGDVLTNTTSTLPSGANFDDKTGKFTWTPTTQQTGSFEVTFTVSDGKLSDSEVVTITVSAVTQPLTITSVNANPESVNEGSSVELSVTYSDPGTTGAHTVAWNFGDGTTGSGESVTHKYVDNNDYTVTVTVTNSGGASASQSLLVKVNNVAPVLGAIVVPIDPNAITQSIIVKSPLTDPGTLDTFTAKWTWDDGTNSSANLPAGSTTIPGTHTYKTPGIYTISLNVTDKDGGKDYAEATSFVVIYDPNGGFVTGGGWINSPVGAYTKNPLLSGKATFGFVSKYQKGKTLPTGNTEFQFHVANMNFHSEYYDWLVIAGPKAQYKGNGTINNAGAYGFMLTAVDGNVKDGGGVDKFRIKIWNKTAGDEIVYDNKMDAPDDADPTTAIASGSIVIHK
jgi:PKD repeat protein